MSQGVEREKIRSKQKREERRKGKKGRTRRRLRDKKDRQGEEDRERMEEMFNMQSGFGERSDNPSCCQLIMPELQESILLPLICLQLNNKLSASSGLHLHRLALCRVR